MPRPHESGSATSDTYREWIDVYCGDEYQVVCQEFGVLMDKAFQHRLGETDAETTRMLALQKRFNMATKLEAGFWQMGLEFT